MKTRSLPRRSAAFTLIELLTVVTIMALLATLASNALTDATRSTRLSGAAEMLTGAINQARTMALARNGTTELRLISQPAGDPPRYLQIVLLRDDGSTLPLTRTQSLPDGMIIATSPSHSGVLNIATQTVETGQPQAGAAYHGIRFGSRGEPRDPTGSVLADPNNFLTVVSQRDYHTATLPSNWIALSIDDRTGAVRRFQP